MRNNRSAVKSRPKKFRWSDHHYINRNLALDLANTIVYRDILERREDRLRSKASLREWSRAGGYGASAAADVRLGEVLAAREAIDRFFRLAAAGRLDMRAWRKLVQLYAAAVPARGHAKPVGGLSLPPDGARPAGLVAHALHSALDLAFSRHFTRLKICPGCGWLFIDRTRNGRKRWCIMALCGNRNKMHRYYQRKRGARLTT
jgi:predicted RNA-binding Zn ribbon-like protein